MRPSTNLAGRQNNQLVRISQEDEMIFQPVGDVVDVRIGSNSAVTASQRDGRFTFNSGHV